MCVCFLEYQMEVAELSVTLGPFLGPVEDPFPPPRTTLWVIPELPILREVEKLSPKRRRNLSKVYTAAPA